MASAAPAILSDSNDSLRSDTSMTTQHPPLAPIPTIETTESRVSVDQQSSSPSSPPHPNETSAKFLSPTPALLATSKFQAFDLQDLISGPGGLESLGPEIASADITVAADGSFIESSSGPAVRELKRRYDQLAGVGPNVRTPYAITAFVSQHGKSMYRISHRDHSAPGATASDLNDSLVQAKAGSDSSQSPRTKRRSRLSMHFLPAFTKSSVPATVRPPTAGSTTTTTTASRKLRKTRSIPDMFGTGAPDPIVEPGSTVTAFPSRTHSHSVTSMDAPARPQVPQVLFPPARNRNLDVFAEIMDWISPPSSSSNISTTGLYTPGKVIIQQPQVRLRPTIAYPFGSGVGFTVPQFKAAPDEIPEHIPTPRHLREMQSFESGLTARQGSRTPELPSSDSPVPSELSVADHEISRPPSAIRLSVASTLLSVTNNSVTSDKVDTPELTLSPASLQLPSHYSAEVFNVLQTYRGLPMLDRIPDFENTTIKLSLAADQSAAPRDDPRFVIWGEVLVDHDVDDYHSTSRDSLTDFSPSNASSSLSRRRNSKLPPRSKAPESSSSRTANSNEGPPRILLAATIERWIAQLTSDLNYDELLNFFLTYRTYVSAVDLCHLLICRFHWALEAPKTTQDETVRRIVRVRTFVAIRYWLVTFFTVDFIPNRELRLLLADWLNTLVHDPVLKKHVDGFNIVRRLVKVAKECKRAHIRAAEKPKPLPKTNDEDNENVDHVLGKSFAKAIRKPTPDDEESDIDLDFLPDDAKADETTSGFPSDPANAHLAVSHPAVAVSATSRPTSLSVSSLPASSLSILQRTDHAPGPNPDGESHYISQAGTVSAPERHSALSRAFVRTIGRLGRWKRVLHPRTSTSTVIRPSPLGACGANISAFDLDLATSQDLLTTNGGVEQYLKKMESRNAQQLVTPNSAPANVHGSTSMSVSTLAVRHPLIPPMPTTPPPVPPAQLSDAHSPVVHSTPLIEPALLEVEEEDTIASDRTFEAPSSISGEEPVAEPHIPNVPPSQPPTIPPEQVLPPAYIQSLRSERADSWCSSSTDSFGEPLESDGPLPPTFPGTHNQWQFDVASIDDLDFSDTASLACAEPLHPPGLRKGMKKLPMRRDFEFLRRSQVSSFGVVSRESVRESVASSAHSAETSSSSGPPKPIQRWQMKSLQQTFEEMSNGEDDKGDVEAALRRLEGQINPKVQQEKQEKVDGWVRTLQERMANGDYDYENSIFSEDEREGFFDEVDTAESDDTDDDQPVLPSDTEVVYEEVARDVHTPLSSETSHAIMPPPGLEGLGVSPPKLNADAPASLEDAVPMEILQTRIPVAPTIPTVSSKFAKADGPSHHTSFILNHQAELLAHHFAMIDRELFMSVKFEELVVEDWMDVEEINVLDWAQYLKDRALWKSESRLSQKTTALAALRARFNLMVNFVISEIVLTAPAERPFVVSKFIRIAWKSYSINNFHTMTAIITALQRDWVTRAMRKPGWGRISGYENRMFRDLKQFTSGAEEFKFMRQAVDAIKDAKQFDSRAASVVSGGDSQGKAKNLENRPAIQQACIPFIGIYLAQLQNINQLPALIDPTAPNTFIGIDPETAIFEPPAHPEVFSALTPLPDSMHLEPLMNVHKQRRIADVIKSLVAGQHLASRVQFEVDKKIFHSCLRIRGLDNNQLQIALSMYSE